MALFGGFFGRRSRDHPVNQWTLTEGYPDSVLTRSASGANVSPSTAMQLSAVYACVRILAETVASLPLHLMRYNDSGGKEKAITHPLYYLLHDQPNEEMTSFVFRETMMTQLLLWGNAYAQKVYNGYGELIGIYPLLSSNMTVERNERGQLIYRYVIESDQKDAGSLVTLRREDVLHIPGLGFNGLVGFSPISMARQAIGTALACEEFGGKFFANGTMPSGVIEHPGTIKDVKAFREKWQEAFAGAANAGKTPILENGMKFNKISINPQDAQFLETRKYQNNEIARIFRIPPHMVGDLEKSSFANIEHQSLEFVKYSLDPWVIRWEQGLAKDILSTEEKRKYYWNMNVDGLLRGDYASRMNGYAVARQNGWMNANDIRAMEDMNLIPPEEGGDLYMVNGNMLPLNQAGAFASTSGKEVEPE